jgi:predicted LPLAT superfamily acyltransferase
VYKISQALSNNEILCIHGDRFLEGSKTVQVPFFNKLARFPAGPFQLASITKSPVCFVFAMKQTAFHYQFYATPFKYYMFAGNDNKDYKLKEWVTEYAIAIETVVRKHPEQWFNYYDFWN